jgi:hypothetical protein
MRKAILVLASTLACFGLLIAPIGVFVSDADAKGAKTVSVKSYTKKSGTTVSSYKRSKPSKK